MPIETTFFNTYLCMLMQLTVASIWWLRHKQRSKSHFQNQ